MTQTSPQKIAAPDVRDARIRRLSNGDYRVTYLLDGVETFRNFGRRKTQAERLMAQINRDAR